MDINSKPANSDIRLIHARKLRPIEVIRAGEALKKFVQKHRNKTNQWCWNKLGITKRSFYRFLAVGRWSKRIKNLVVENQKPLSQTVLFALADKAWKGARQLFNKLKQWIEHLALRKRKTLDRLKKVVDKISAYLQKRKEKPLQKKYKIIYQAFGKISQITTTNLDQSLRFIKASPGFQYLIHPRTS